MTWWKLAGRNRRARCVLDDDPKFQCCGCCHVQTGTICLGIYNLLLQVVCMSVLVFAILHPDMLLDSNHIDFEVRAPNGGLETSTTMGVLIPANEPGLKSSLEPFEPIRSSEMGRKKAMMEKEECNREMEFYSRRDMLLFTRKRVESGDAHLALALVFGLVMITMLMVYGALKSRPVYLLPFFCFQVFDFILACLTAVGHYTWLPNIHHAINKHEEMPFRHYLLKMNSEWLALCILLAYVLVLVVKAYFVGIVWACYQYLHLRNSSILRYTEVDGAIAPDYDGELLLPPDYEAASKLPPIYPGPPPGYSSCSE